MSSQLASAVNWKFALIIAAALVMSTVPGVARAPQLSIMIESASPYFMPVEAATVSGTAIRWINPTAAHHTITHDLCLTTGPCAFESKVIAPNESYTIPSLPPGHYPYHCGLHPIMRGVLMVRPAADLPSTI